MKQSDKYELSFDEFDERVSPRPEDTDFSRLCDRLLSRRNFVKGSLAFGASAFVTGGPAAKFAQAADSRLGFRPVVANVLDTVTVPEGYNWHIVSKWGDALWSDSPEFDDRTRGTGASQELTVGDNNDGMALFQHNGRNILVSNNEYVNRGIIYGNRDSGLPENADDIRKGKAGHGITICEITFVGGEWRIFRDSPYNRRITADTPMELTGPARGHELMKTAADPSGTRSLGTWNNCGSGRTPWGTYLACEENFNGYFSGSDTNHSPTDEQKRYGISNEDWGYNWASEDERFDISRHPNEPHRAGYIVEIDPLDPTSIPRKRTALGRFKHENAEVVVADSGRIVVYTGDDERGEFLYKYVSHDKYSEGGDNSSLLDNGTLFAAVFDDTGRGNWVPLTTGNTGAESAAEICIFTRMAASAVGATTMDRPEWIAAHPNRDEMYCALTNNKNRGKKTNKGGDDMPAFGPNPRVGNNYGQIVRWRPVGDHTSSAFTWDLFVLAGNPSIHNDAYAGSDNVTPDNMFNSPDGLAFDSRGLLWIQTDGNYSNEGDFEGMGNNQMLVGDPATGEIRRFMVGPKECEITGLTWSADKRTLFAGIQHPGERGNSHFPDGGDRAPRSSIIAIQRDDGGVLG